MSPPIHPLTSSQGAVFLINSRLGIFRCGPDLHQGRPYSEVTAAFLPSSLRTSHSFALVYSTKPPVSVYGTGSLQLSLEDFLGSALRIIYPGEPGHFSYAWTNVARIFLKLHPHVRDTHPIMCDTYSPPSLHRIATRSRNINRVSIACGFRHSLRPD